MWSLHLGIIMRVVAYNIAKVQNIRCIVSTLKVLSYGSMEWNMEENFSMQWNMEWKILSMEWKKIASMEYGKIVFHSIPYHALYVNDTLLKLTLANNRMKNTSFINKLFCLFIIKVAKTCY